MDDLWRGELNRAAELRLRSAKLGLTHEDRLKSRICYVTPADQDDEESAVDPTAARTMVEAASVSLAGLSVDRALDVPWTR